MTLDKSRILYIDDDSDAGEMLKFLLEQEIERCLVTSVSVIDKALKLIETHSFDLYILDQRMSEMTGVELCRLIRQTDSQTPIVFYTGMAGEADRRAAMAAGANEYLVKPNNLDVLSETIKKLISASPLKAKRNYPEKKQMRDRIY